MVKETENPTVRFRAELVRDRMFYYVMVPERVTRRLEPFSHAKRVPVTGTASGLAFQGTLLPLGQGRQVLVLNADLRRRAGLSVGDTVSLELEPCAPDLVRVPEDLAARLKAERLVRVFDALAPSHRRAFLRYLDTAKSPTTRARYLDKVVARLKGEAPTTASSSRRAGWRCPACARWFLHEDTPHPCAPVPLAVPFENRDPAVFALFEAVRAAVAALGPVTLQVSRDLVGMNARRRVLDVRPRKSWLELGFWLPRRLEHPRFRRVVTVGMSLHVHLLRLTAASDIDDELRGWLAEAWTHGAPKTQAPPTWDRPIEDRYFEDLGE
jgi:hypothetical protein